MKRFHTNPSRMPLGCRHAIRLARVDGAAGARSRRPRQPVSLVDVAARAGVSTATASRSLRGGDKVAPGTRQRVLDAAHELAYATALRPADGNAEPRLTVAVIVPDITRWFFSAATAGVVDQLRAHGYEALLFHLGSSEVRDHLFARLPLAGRVDGIVSLSMPLTEEHTLSLRALGIPLVSVGSSIDGFPSVGIDEVDASRTAVHHLLNLGHERIGLLAGQADDAGFDFLSSMGRRLGYEEALTAAGIDPDPCWVASGRHGIEGGAAAMAELLGRPRLPTAVLAEYDELALGALWTLRRAGLRVPADISVIGIDDHEMAASCDLTTIGQSVKEQGELAARLLLQLLGPGSGRVGLEKRLLPTRLILRGSTGPAHRSGPTGPDDPGCRPDERQTTP